LSGSCIDCTVDSRTSVMPFCLWLHAQIDWRVVQDWAALEVQTAMTSAWLVSA
jgi:hypothetical protein